MERRVAFLDGVKGFGILSIILGHVFIPGWNDFLFLYHLPIFFLLAGYFTSAKRPMKAFAGNRARRLLVPYAVTAALIVLFSIPKSLAEHTSVVSGLKKWGLAALQGVGVEPKIVFHMESIGAIWFLWALFWASLLLRFLISTEHRYFRLAAVLALFVTGVISIRTVFLPLSIQPAFAALLWMYVGWLVRQGKEYIARETEAGTAFGEAYETYHRAAFGALFLFALSLFLHAAFRYRPFLMVSATFDGGLLGILGSFAGSAVVFGTVWFLYRWKDRFLKPVCLALTWLGQNSLLLLCVHIIEQDLIPWKHYYGAAGLEGAAFYAAVFFSKLAFVLAAGFLVSKTPANKLFTG